GMGRQCRLVYYPRQSEALAPEPPMRYTVLSILTGVLVASAGVYGAALGQECAAAKVKAAGFGVYADAKCYQKAVQGGGVVDGGCLATAEQRFVAAFGSAEARGGCGVTGDASVIEGRTHACLTSFTGAIMGSARCAAAKLGAVGKETYGKAKCKQKAIL